MTRDKKQEQLEGYDAFLDDLEKLLYQQENIVLCPVMLKMKFNNKHKRNKTPRPTPLGSNKPSSDMHDYS